LCIHVKSIFIARGNIKSILSADPVHEVNKEKRKKKEKKPVGTELDNKCVATEANAPSDHSSNQSIVQQFASAG
jgi:hypothetical protein